jgi:DNA-binding transcriptional LysR family regulator
MIGRSKRAPAAAARFARSSIGALELQEPLRRALEEVRRVTVTGGAFDPAGASLTLTIAASDYVQVAVLLDFTLRLRGAAPNIRIGIHNRSERLAVFEPPIKVPGFAISLLWHDRTHDHPAHVWVRSKIAQWI